MADNEVSKVTAAVEGLRAQGIEADLKVVNIGTIHQLARTILSPKIQAAGEAIVDKMVEAKFDVMDTAALAAFLLTGPVKYAGLSRDRSVELVSAVGYAAADFHVCMNKHGTDEPDAAETILAELVELLAAGRKTN